MRQMHGRQGQSVVLLSVLVSEILTLHTAVHPFRFPREAQAVCVDAALFQERRMRSTVEKYKAGLNLRAAMSVRRVFWSCFSRMINERPYSSHTNDMVAHRFSGQCLTNMVQTALGR